MSITKNLSQIKEYLSTNSPEEQVEFETQMLALLFISEIEKEANKQGINRKELGEKVGKSSSYISQLFSGNKIPNLKILTAMGLALGKKFNVIAVNNIEEARRFNCSNIDGPKFDSYKLAERHSDNGNCQSYNSENCLQLDANLKLSQV